MNSKLHNFLQLAGIILIPWKNNCDYFVAYFKAVQQIRPLQNGSHKNLDYQTSTKLIIYTIYAGLALMWLRFLALSVLDQTEPLAVMLGFDALYIFMRKTSINYLALLATTLIVYYFYALFVRPNYRLLDDLRRIIVCQQWAGHFIAPTDAKKGEKLCNEVTRFHLRATRIFLMALFPFGNSELKWQLKCI